MIVGSLLAQNEFGGLRLLWLLLLEILFPFCDPVILHRLDRFFCATRFSFLFFPNFFRFLAVR